MADPSQPTIPKPTPPEPTPAEAKQAEQVVVRRRWQLLIRLERLLEAPMMVLSFIWLVLLVTEFSYGWSPLLETIFLTIWIIFGVEFVISFLLAPEKIRFLGRRWMSIIALIIPSFRLLRAARAFRFLRLARTARSIQLARVFTTLNRGMRTLAKILGRRGFGYAALLTVIVTLVGAAGMQAFESEQSGFGNYGSALWWTAMLMTTLGSADWPVTPEGRILAFVLALYGFAVFGYVTATVASFFIGRDAELDKQRSPELVAIQSLQEEISALREEMNSLRSRTAADDAGVVVTEKPLHEPGAS